MIHTGTLCNQANMQLFTVVPGVLSEYLRIPTYVIKKKLYHSHCLSVSVKISGILHQLYFSYFFVVIH